MSGGDGRSSDDVPPEETVAAVGSGEVGAGFDDDDAADGDGDASGALEVPSE